MSAHRITAAPLILVVLICAIGCASYHTGPASPAQAGTIYVAQAENDSFMAQIGPVLTEKVRDAFLHDTQTRLVRKGQADMILEITIENVDREGRVRGTEVEKVDVKNGQKVITTTNDTGLFKAYNVILTARAVLTNTRTGKVISDHVYQATNQTLPSPYTLGSADDERILMPILARELARQIHDAVAERWDESQSDASDAR
jgi:hypothetical protein